MYVIKANNVNDAYYQGLDLINREGFIADSRNGKVLKLSSPLCVEYNCPHERVLFDAVRDANPFLHLFEAIWMLAGSNDVKWIGRFGPNLLNYSDDGETLHGAYGHRWRNHFGWDQISEAIDALIKNPGDRRIVIGMWDPYIDSAVAEAGGKDVPCNTQIYFNVRPDASLSMTVTNRSNDMVWGMFGANAVHMSVLHEYVSLATGIRMGTYWQVSNDVHVYEKHFDLVKNPNQQDDPYGGGVLTDPIDFEPLWNNHPMIFPKENRTMFDTDVRRFIEDPFQLENNYQTTFFRQTVSRMARTWSLHKEKLRESSLQMADQINAEDWRKAVKEWLERRHTITNHGIKVPTK